MDKLLPYQVLMQTKGLSKNDLPKEVKATINTLERTIRGIAMANKKDAEGNLIVTENTKAKIDELDKQLVNQIWDYLDEKQMQELRGDIEPKKEVKEPNPNPIVEPKNQEPKPPVVEPTVEPKKEEEQPKKKDSSGRIGFFDW